MNIPTALLVAAGLGAALSQSPKLNRSIFERRYREGERMTYRMKGINEKWRYQIDASGVVMKDSQGQWIVEYAWSHLVSNGTRVVLPPSGTRYREVVSLDPVRPPVVENLKSAPHVLVGPITDLGTFYVDLWLAERLGDRLARAGDHAYVKIGTLGSWADGKRGQVGESAVDFYFRLLKVDSAAHAATLQVQHEPPPRTASAPARILDALTFRAQAEQLGSGREGALGICCGCWQGNLRRAEEGRLGERRDSLGARARHGPRT